ncbi:MAG: hypothetical protein IPM34_02250 [Saprospiraceae bacterium]|nr:hypothetical protein [Saprospiraceae bacterium]
MKISIQTLFLSLLICALLTDGCVSRRKKGETSALGRFYHNTTSKYNGYFNANEIMQEVVLTLHQNHKDNYNKILPVFPYNAVESADPVKSKLDKAIEKVGVVITNHRVSHWTDDCYLLLAKAQYLKKDYETAESSYKFFLEEYDPFKNRLKSKKIKAKTSKEKKKEAEELKKERQKAAEQKAKDRKKAQKERAKARKNKSKPSEAKPADDKKPAADKSELATPTPVTPKQDQSDLTNEGSWLFPHYPAYWEGAIWAGKNLVERGKPYEAEQLFRKVENDPYARSELKAELYASYADLYLKTDQDAKAISALKSAIEFSEEKKERARYAYILGQLYQKAARYENSNEYFNACIKDKAGYDLVFHARLNVLLNDAAAGNSVQEIAKKMEKLLEDPKNSDYKGEMYYALGMISLKDGNKDTAVSYFNLSLRSPNVSNTQRAESFYQLGEYYFEQQDYLKAKNYYDSTMTMMGKTDPRRIAVAKVVANLEEIAKHLESISLNDSLLRIAALSVKDKRALAIQLKNAKKAKVPEAVKDNRSRFAELDGLAANPFGRENFGNQDSKKTQSNFFAYDQRSINRGRSEFEQTWGNRNLEDNWRRKNKNTFSINEIVSEEVEEEQDSLEADLAQILKGIPETPEQILDVKNKIAESKFQLGVLYREKLDNFVKSSQSLKNLLEEYPKTQRKPDALYYLYLNCLDLSDDACMHSYKDQIIYEFPGSHYGKVLSDPEYVKGLLAKRDEITNEYNKAYSYYSNKQFKEALDLLQLLKNRMGGGHKLLAKAALLSAFCIGNTEGKDVYMNALKDVVANHPSTPEEIKAKEILRFLKGDQDAFVQIRASELDKFNFKQEDEKLHFMLVVLYNPEDKIENKIKISISDYNVNYHQPEKLKMTSVELDTESNNPILVIRKFDTKKQAMKYFEGVMKKPEEFIPDFDNWELLAVTQNNYREILRLKSLSEYKSYFKKNYEGKE